MNISHHHREGKYKHNVNVDPECDTIRKNKEHKEQIVLTMISAEARQTIVGGDASEVRIAMLSRVCL